MKIALYLSKNVFLPEGGYVLVPGCFLPSIECERLYGPLLACGQMTISDDQGEGRWQPIIADIDRNNFALIDTTKAEHLFGVRIMRTRAGSLERISRSFFARSPERSGAENQRLDVESENASNDDTVQYIQGPAHVRSQQSNRA